MNSGIKDKILYSSLKRKNKKAFITLYDRYLDDIYRFVFFKVGDKELAEDITSGVFLKIWNYIQENSLKDYKNLKSFLYTVARNAIIDHYRLKSNQYEFSVGDELDRIDKIDKKQNLEEKIDLKLEIEQLHRSLDKLKSEYKEVLLLRFVNQLSVKETAEVLEKDKGNVRVLTYRALKALKKIIKNG